MAITNCTTSDQTFRKLMGYGLVYRVPMFQRDYSWTEQEWDDLWQDIVAMLEPGGELGHYLGYLDPVTLISTPRLQLNRHNDPYDQTHAG